MPGSEDESLNVFTMMIRLKRKVFADGDEIHTIRNRGFSAVSNSADRNIFRGMYQTLEKLYDRFNERWDAAAEFSETHNASPPFPAPDDEGYREQVKRYYYEAIGYHAQIISPISNERPNQLNPNGEPSNASTMWMAPHRTFLPKIKIKTFCGEQSDWPTFKQLFTSLVSDDASLSNTERFHYLLSFLDGPALRTIKHLTVTNENFPLAFETLCRTYDNKRKLACTYLHRLLTFKPHSGRPSADSLQDYLANVTDSISSLENLAIPNLAPYLLCELALKCLDPITREAFEFRMVGTEFPTFQLLRDFVQERCQVLRLTQEPTCSANRPPNSTQSVRPIKPPNKFEPPKPYGQALLVHHQKSADGPTCFICNGDHILRDCSEFEALSPSQRLSRMKKYPGCLNCFHPKHKTSQCPSAWSCRYCNRRHHSLLHLTTSDPKTSTSNDQRISCQTTNNSATSFNSTVDASGEADRPTHTSCEQESHQLPSTSFSGASTSTTGGVLLGTVKAHLLDSTGHKIEFRGLLDPGSEYSFITTDCANQLGIAVRPFHQRIFGVNGTPVTHARGRTNITFITKTVAQLTTEAVVVPTITPPLPQTPLTSSKWTDYQSFNLSDPSFTTPSKISFLIGADLYPDVVTGVPVTIHRDGPRIMDTIFGYTVIGKYGTEIPNNNVPQVSLLTMTNTTSRLQKFWEPKGPVLNSTIRISPARNKCDAQPIKTHHSSGESRYTGTLPHTSSSTRLIPKVASTKLLCPGKEALKSTPNVKRGGVVLIPNFLASGKGRGSPSWLGRRRKLSDPEHVQGLAQASLCRSHLTNHP